MVCVCARVYEGNIVMVMLGYLAGLRGHSRAAWGGV